MGLAALAISANCIAGADFTALAARCAADVHPATVRALVGHESAFDPLVIGVNGSPREVIHPATLAAAISTATQLIAAGRSIDVGLGQINSKNFRRLGLTVGDAFDPCLNIAAAARLLRESYTRLLATGLGQRSALDAALSEYNTGSAAAGIANGYVAAVHAKSQPAYAVPDISNPADPELSATTNDPTGPVILDSAPPSPAAAWDVFGDATSTSRDGMTVPKETVSPPGPSAPTVRAPGAAVVLSALPDQSD